MDDFIQKKTERSQEGIDDVFRKTVNPPREQKKTVFFSLSKNNNKKGEEKRATYREGESKLRVHGAGHKGATDVVDKTCLSHALKKKESV